MAAFHKVRAAKVRVRERAVWSDVEKVGRDLCAADAAKTTVTQAEADTSRSRPKENLEA